ncbi:MAG: hypothetical protein IJ301_03440 [Clostridia bacterium]|nr:hypothetical protein [Clostridia bacterium]
MKNLIFKEDVDVVVAYKQQNIAMKDFVNSLQEYFNDNQELKPIYDLDLLCGGIVVCARNEQAYNNLKEAYCKNKFEFDFYAVTVGTPKFDSGTYSAHVTFDKKYNKLTHIPQLNAGAEGFGLTYATLERVQQIALVDIKLNTFIPETIRFAMADLGMPIFGDAVYGGDSLAKNTNTAFVLGKVRIVEGEGDEGGQTFVAMPPSSKPWTYFDLTKISKL